GRFLYGAQYQRMLRYEGRTLARFDGVLAVSDADRQTFARLYPGAIRQPVHVVPTGVDTDYFAPSDIRTRSEIRTPQSGPREPQAALSLSPLDFARDDPEVLEGSKGGIQ